MTKKTIKDVLHDIEGQLYTKLSAVLDSFEDDVIIGGEPIDEFTARLKRIKPQDKLKAKKNYRKNKSKLKLKNRKFRRSAAGKKLARKAKRMGKLGKTSTGKRIVRRK